MGCEDEAQWQDRWAREKTHILTRYKDAIDLTHQYFPHAPKMAKQVLIGYAERLRRRQTIYPWVEDLVKMPEGISRAQFEKALHIVSEVLKTNNRNEDSLSDARGLLHFYDSYGPGKKRRIDIAGLSYETSPRGPQILTFEKIGAFVFSYLCRRLSLYDFNWSATPVKGHYHVWAGGQKGKPRWPLVAALLRGALDWPHGEEEAKSLAKDVKCRSPLILFNDLNPVLFCDDPADPHETFLALVEQDLVAAWNLLLKQQNPELRRIFIDKVIEMAAETERERQGGASFGSSAENSSPDGGEE